jgi:hypothetical protein
VDVDEAIQIDYSRSWQEVYTRVCHWLHRRHHNLAFLQLVEIRNRNLKDGVDLNRNFDLPSWVPNFRSEPYYLNMVYQPIQKLRDFRAYYDSGATKSSAKAHNIYTPYLRLQRLKIGKNLRLSSPSGNLSKGIGIGEKVLEGGEWCMLARTCADEYGLYTHTKEPIELALERLRVGDCQPGSSVRTLRKKPPHRLPQPQTYMLGREGIALGDGSFIIKSNRTDIGACILRATMRRRMFTTDTDYIGLTHRSNLIGDEVWVLMGGEMPVTLQPVAKKAGWCMSSGEKAMFMA